MESLYPVGNSEPLKILELGHDNTLGRSIRAGFTEIRVSRDAGKRGGQFGPGMSEGRSAKAGQMDAGGRTLASAKWLA